MRAGRAYSCPMGASRIFERPREPGFLDGQFLVAMPGMEDPRFKRAVVYMCAHSAEGAMGIVINHSAPHISFSDLLVQLKIIPQAADILLPPGTDEVRVLQGGPVEQAQQLFYNRRAEIIFERLGIVGERAKQSPADVANP